MRNYTDYNDFLKQYEQHKEKSDARTHLYREEGWDKLNKKYGPGYEDAYDKMEDMEDPLNENYKMYRERYYSRYWDTSDNDRWYS